MNRTTTFVLLLTAVLGVGACASAGGGGSDPTDDWTGPTPEDNEWTTQANLYLVRALRAESEDEKRALAQQALAAAQTGIENDPQNPQVWFLAGQAHADLGQYSRADSMFDRATDLYPHYEQVEFEREESWVEAYNRGVNALNNGDNSAALEAFSGAAALWDGRPAAHLQVGALSAQAGETGAAIDAFDKALEIIRGPAAEAADTSITAQWDRFEQIATFNLGQLYASDGDYDQAAQTYRAYLARYPDNLDARMNLAVVLSRAGNQAEASAIYDELLQRSDLSSNNYLMVGIGLFQAERYEEAADAFSQALEQNPQSRDAAYNLAQTYFVRADELEEAYDSAATAAAQDSIRAELTPLYDRLQRRIAQVREMDPYNRNVLALQGRAYRGLADAATDSATANEWRQRALRIFERHRDLPFEVSDVSIGGGTGEIQISGVITNLSMDAGQPIRLQFTLVDESGATLATPTVTVAAPEQSRSTSFRASAQVQNEVAGWRYESVN